MYPDPVRFPGFTYPAYNPDVALSKLAWAPDADDSDRIDYIYFKSAKGLQLSSHIVGPEQTVRYGKVQSKDSEDKFILPSASWPSDHKGLLAHFTC